MYLYIYIHMYGAFLHALAHVHCVLFINLMTLMKPSEFVSCKQRRLLFLEKKTGIRLHFAFCTGNLWYSEFHNNWDSSRNRWRSNNGFGSGFFIAATCTCRKKDCFSESNSHPNEPKRLKWLLTVSARVSIIVRRRVSYVFAQYRVLVTTSVWLTGPWVRIRTEERDHK